MAGSAVNQAKKTTASVIPSTAQVGHLKID